MIPESHSKYKWQTQEPNLNFLSLIFSAVPLKLLSFYEKDKVIESSCFIFYYLGQLRVIVNLINLEFTNTV